VVENHVDALRRVMRGAAVGLDDRGGNFGVVTCLRYRLHRLPGVVGGILARTGFADGIGEDAAELIVEPLAVSDAPLRAVQLRALGGAMARVPADATAFAHRFRRLMVNVAPSYEGPEDPPARRAWVEELSADLMDGPGSTSGSWGRRVR
jgi:hypothetical protein